MTWANYFQPQPSLMKACSTWIEWRTQHHRISNLHCLSASVINRYVTTWDDAYPAFIPVCSLQSFLWWSGNPYIICPLSAVMQAGIWIDSHIPPQQNTPLSGPGDSQTGIGCSDDYFYLVASYFWTTAIWCQADDAPLRPRKIHTKFLAGSLGPKGSASPTVLAQLHIL
jgi:hypothetical protein